MVQPQRSHGIKAFDTNSLDPEVGVNTVLGVCRAGITATVLIGVNDEDCRASVGEKNYRKGGGKGRYGGAFPVRGKERKETEERTRAEEEKEKKEKKEKDDDADTQRRMTKKEKK